MVMDGGNEVVAVAVLMDGVDSDIVRDARCNIVQRRKGFRDAAVCPLPGSNLGVRVCKVFRNNLDRHGCHGNFSKIELVYRTMVKQYASLRT